MAVPAGQRFVHRGTLRPIGTAIPSPGVSTRGGLAAFAKLFEQELQLGGVPEIQFWVSSERGITITCQNRLELPDKRREP